MNKLELGNALKIELKRGYDITRISRWAFHLFSQNVRELNPYLTQVLQNLFSMEDDPQFELSEDELLLLANNLILEGEKEELNQSTLEIKDVATDLGDYWLMCPLCQKFWKSDGIYRMVICPGCDSRLLNPKFGFNK